MWNRMELKMRGKFAFQRNYWPCVLVSFVVMLGTVLTVKDGADSSNFLRIGSIALSGGALTLLNILVFSVLEVSGARFYMENASANANAGLISFGFRSGTYGTIVAAQLLRKIFIILWSLLLVIPGIMKAYSYCLVPYVLADRTDITASEALEISKNMMEGHRWATFELDLSFIGWFLLSAITGGLVGVFYVNPYVHATRAELYFALREGR